jgi:hypothetical protein
MGPNSKKRSRKQYIKYRLRVLRELHIAPPPEKEIERLSDEKQMSEIAVDNFFIDYIRKAR